MNQDKMMMILENEELMEKLLTVKTPEELEKALDTLGYALDGITPKDAFDLIQEKIKKAENDELSEDELEAVSGGWYNIAGIALQAALTAKWAAIALPVVGVCVAIGVGKHLISKATKKR